MKKSLYLIDYLGNHIDIKLPFKLKDINAARMDIITNDEVLTVIRNDGQTVKFDSDTNNRYEDKYCGGYYVIKMGKWVVDKEWFIRDSSTQFLTKYISNNNFLN